MTLSRISGWKGDERLKRWIFTAVLVVCVILPRPAQALTPEQWPLPALVATNSVQFEDRPTFVGEVAVTRQATGAVLANNAELSIGSDAVINGNVRADTIYIFRDGTINGNVGRNGLTNLGTINGTVTAPLSLPLSITVPTVPAITTGTTDVNLVANEKRSLVSGNYRNVSLVSGNGGQKTILTLTGGLYQFLAISVTNDARIECAAACEIRVSGRVAVGHRSYIGPKPGVAGLGSGNVQLLVNGTNGSSGPNGNPPALLIDHDSELRAYALVPNGTLRLGHRVVVRGKLVGRDVVVGHNDDARGQQLALITTNPVSITVRERATATFTVSASGTGLTYQWQRNGVNIPGATSASYTTPPTVAADTNSRFRVLIVSEAGTVTSSEAILTVIPCTLVDVTCDGWDDDCDGVVDDDVPPECNGTFIRACVGGVMQDISNCRDANFCNGAETCVGGACVEAPDEVDGTSCGDDNDCNGVDECYAGKCEHIAHVPLDPRCATETCGPSTNQKWEVAFAPSGASCGDGDPSNGEEFCNGVGMCVGTPDIGSTFGDVVSTCTEASNPLTLSGYNPAADTWTTIQVSTPGAGCSVPVFARDAECTQLVWIEQLQSELLDPGMSAGPCEPLGPGGSTRCPVDPATIRQVDCQGLDTLCNQAIGEQCFDRCANPGPDGMSNCYEVEWVCARTKLGCEGPLVLADDVYDEFANPAQGERPGGCAEDVWVCTDPAPEVGVADALSLQMQVGTKGEASMLQVPGTVQTSPLPYASLAGTHACGFPPVINKAGKTGVAADDRPSSTAPGTGMFGDSYVIGGDQFGIFAQPTFFHEYQVGAEDPSTPGVDRSYLDHVGMRADAQGALVGGARVFGNDVTVLDADAHAFVDQCGVDAAARLTIFGDIIAAVPGVNSKNPLCTDALESLNSAVESLRELAIMARQLRAIYLPGPGTPSDPQAVCDYMGPIWAVDGEDFDCASLANLENGPQDLDGQARLIVDAMINTYKAQIATYLAQRAQYLALARTAQAGAGEASDTTDAVLPATPFVAFSIEQPIPLGPVSLVVAASLSGNYGLDGGFSYDLNQGFDAQGVVALNPSVAAGAVARPYLSADAALFVGLGFDFGIGGVSVGVEGQLTLLDVSVPITAQAFIQGEVQTDAQLGRDVQLSDWAGAATGVPSDVHINWKLGWGFGGRIRLEVLSGRLNAAARVRFLFYSKTFRKKITDWQGFNVGYSLAEQDPSQSGNPNSPLTPFGNQDVPLGWSDENIGYTDIPVLDGNWILTQSGTESLCKPVWTVRTR